MNPPLHTHTPLHTHQHTHPKTHTHTHTHTHKSTYLGRRLKPGSGARARRDNDARAPHGLALERVHANVEDGGAGGVGFGEEDLVWVVVIGEWVSGWVGGWIDSLRRYRSTVTDSTPLFTPSAHQLGRTTHAAH
jgi:hypothetical protein